MSIRYKLKFTSIFQICLVCLFFSHFFPERILILNTDTSVFLAYWYWYWYFFSILQIEYWYWYFSIWKSYWILNTSIFILYWSGLLVLTEYLESDRVGQRVQGSKFGFVCPSGSTRFFVQNRIYNQIYYLICLLLRYFENTSLFSAKRPKSLLNPLHNGVLFLI